MKIEIKNKILEKYFFKFFDKYTVKTHRNNIQLLHFPKNTKRNNINDLLGKWSFNAIIIQNSINIIKRQ